MPIAAITDEAARAGGRAKARVLALLEQGVPLTLLLDLACPGGPDTRAIMEDERRAVA